MTTARDATARLDLVQRRALLVGTLALAASAVGAVMDPAQFFQSYLAAFLYWVGLPLGSLALLMIQHLTGGSWGRSIRRLLEGSVRTMPLMALLFVPILLGVHELYPWSHAEQVAQEAALQHKSGYLNVPFFTLRGLGFFAIWIALAWGMNRMSTKLDAGADPRAGARLRMLSGPGLVLLGVSVSFAAIDWGMSLEPLWYSTVYGLLVIVGQVLSALCFAVCVTAYLSTSEPLAGRITKQHAHDLGNLMLTFVLLWIYMAFSQYLIIWLGNLPEEIAWYRSRASTSWQALALALVLLHFAVPFFTLLSRRVKRSLAMLASVAAGLLILRLVEAYWLVIPAFHPEGLHLHWMDVVLPIGMGGLWLFAFVRTFKRGPLVSLDEPGAGEPGQAAAAAI